MERLHFIDMHAHYLTRGYVDFLEKHNALLEDGFPLPQWSPEDHLRFMDEAHIDWSLLSLSSPQPYFADDREGSIAICRRTNEEIAAVVQQHPTRFGFEAVLPLPDVEAACAEAAHTMDELGARGIGLASNSRGLYLGSKELEPLMQELDKRHALCVIHPHRPEPIKEGLFSSGPVPLFEFLADTTRAVLNLIASGTLLRYPNITWVVPHNGSFLPNIYDRFLGLSKILVSKGLMEDMDIPGSFAKLYYDLAGNPAPYLMKWLLTITTPDHLLYGSDYPFPPVPMMLDSQQGLLKVLAEKELQSYAGQICYDNARKLLEQNE